MVRSDFETNKHKQANFTEGMPTAIGENAKRLETLVTTVHWKPIIKGLAIAFALSLTALFITIVVVRAAYHIF